MTELAQLADEAWTQYWVAISMSFGQKIPLSIKPILETTFKGGFIEGYKTKEALEVENCDLATEQLKTKEKEK